MLEVAAEEIRHETGVAVTAVAGDIATETGRAKVLAASDPDRAARLARSITDEKTQAEVLAEAAKAWLQGWVSLWPVPGSICRHAQTTRPT